MNAVPESLKAAGLGGLSGVAHGFFSRRGGVSEGLYQSLNCGPGSGDDPASVKANRAAAAAALGLAGALLVTGYQVHGREVLVVEGTPPGAPARVDGLVTRTPGVVLGVLTADCAPVLLADADAGVVATAHAGWRGAVGGIVEAVVAKMTALGARKTHVQAAVGPCIAQQSYEVGADLRQAVLAHDSGDNGFFASGARAGHWQFDLSAYVTQRLRRAGVTLTEEVGLDTYANAVRFFSYRRACHRGEADYGRCLSAIALLPCPT